ncbi:MAG: hypothetical protein AAGB32_05350, partial [Pseudomonadota bacterium]
EGNRILRDDPKLMYKTVKDLNEQGAFADNLLEQQYVTEFLDATRTLAPEQFGAESDQDALQSSGAEKSIDSKGLKWHEEYSNFESWRHDFPDGQFEGYSLGETVELESGDGITAKGTFHQSADPFNFPYQMEAEQSFTITPSPVIPSPN